METKKSKMVIDSHQRVFISLVLAVIAYFFLSMRYDIFISLIGSWDIFALTDIALAWIIIIRKGARETVQNARLQDSGRATILFFISMAALATLVAITLLLKTAKHSTVYSVETILFFAIFTVAASWILVHTVFTIHYAHVYYGEGGGLIFPEDKAPAFSDFAYFSFVVGMTFQVSDVQVTSKRMRKLTLAHGMISFLFNTFILALSINLITGLF